MAMKWTKLGLVFETNNNHPWMLSHAANPVAEHVYDDVFRLYFSCRDADSRAHIAYADVDIEPPFKVLRVAGEPVLASALKGNNSYLGTFGCLAKNA